MPAPIPLALAETSPGLYEIRWTVPADVDPGTYELTGTLMVGSTTLASAPPAPLTLQPAPLPALEVPGAPAVPAAPPGLPPPPVIEAPAPSLFGAPSDFRFQGIRPDIPFWVDADDLIVMGVRNSLVGLQLALNIKMWSPQGDFIGTQLTVVPPSTRALTFFSVPLGPGYLVDVTVNAAAGSPKRGQCLVSILLARHNPTAFQTYALLGKDYVTPHQGPSWPPGRIVAGAEGTGAVLLIIGTSPPAGSDFTFSVPTGARWRIRNVAANLTTSLVVANRLPDLQVTFTGGGPMRIAGTQATAAGLSQFYYWIPGLPAAGVVDANQTNQWMPPDLVLPGGSTIGPATANLQGGDSWGTPILEVEEVIDE